MPGNRGLTIFIYLTLLVSLVLTPGIVPTNTVSAAPETNYALQFNGSNNYVTFGTATGPTGGLVNAPTWRSNQSGDPFSGGYTLQFNGTSQYVTFGPATFLGVQQFTLETWFYWTGGGAPTSTGTSGLTAAYPLVTKGRGEAENSNLDMNYFLGIQGGKLAADFEECSSSQTGCPAGGTAGLNHPAYGSTNISINTWHHAAVTYNGRYWQFYLDGAPDGSPTDVGATRYPRWDSIQHAGLGTAMTSSGAPAGYFQGVLDEARVWNYARSADEVYASYGQEISSAPGLIGRWGMNEGSGMWLYDTSAPTLGAPTFTLETWFRRDGTGVGTSTGSSGVTAVPLIAKGRADSDGDSRDMNYFLGIDTTTNTLVADFEECQPSIGGCPAGGSAGLNHPISGTTSIPADGVWRHAAVTYDGSVWRVYLNGNLETTSDAIDRYPRWDSIEHASLGTAMTSTGAAAGYFQGAMDETRIWNKVRSMAEIQDAMNQEIASAAGLIGRWGMNEGTGIVIGDSTAPEVNGTYTNAPLWVCGKFAANCGLNFNGSSQYVTFGLASGLGVKAFTIETWFKRTGAGVAASTGNGGVTAIPLVTKGRHEQDGSSVDMNYFLGIDGTSGKLVADFEECTFGQPTGDASCQSGGNAGLNHPVTGNTVISNNVWYHAAATYDGREWRLYLNGVLDGMVTVDASVDRWPRWDSIQHASLATTLDSQVTEIPEGFFAGVLDEVRIWNYARNETEVQTAINQEITSATGLIGRWGMNENQGTIINDSTVSVINGALKNGQYWPTGAPFDITFTPPNGAPSNLTATLAPGSQIDLDWTDGSTNETAFAIEDALGPTCDTWSSLGTLAANSIAFRQWNTTLNTQYCYRVRAANASGTSDWSNITTIWTPPSYSALSLGRDHAYVRIPDDAKLHLQQFTLETWFRREGTGDYNTTGSGGIPQAIPLIAKGAAEAEASTADENFLLVIDDATDTIAADFEECNPADPLTPDCAAGGTAGLNHPILGATTISLNTWYHTAVTYDGTTWRLYLNGSLERELVVGHLPRWDNSSPLGLGTSMTTGGGTQGFFDGSLDEVRIWDYARTEAEIRSTINSQIIEAADGLVARWALDEASGTAVNGSAETGIDGTIYPNPGATGWNWTQDAPFNATLRPALPVSPVPGDKTTDIVINPGGGSDPTDYVNLQATVSDPDTPNLTVSYYGRPYCSSPNFTLAILPDTQYETAQTNSGRIEMFDAQTQWIVDHKSTNNIVFTSHLGDIVDSYADTAQWDRANEALTRLETGSVAFGLAVGNHDGAPGNTGNFNIYFGSARFTGRDYYGGHYGSDNDNNYELLTADNMDFIVIHIEYGADAAVRNWANNLLSVLYPNRRAIVVTHNLLIGNTTPASFSTEGQALYDALKGNPNLFLMLGGHLDTEVSRTDTYNSHTVYSLRSDYQFTTGGNGWMRLLEFQPTANQIQVYTYSPYLNQWDTDEDSQFALPYEMGGASCGAFELINTLTNVSSDTSPIVKWGNRSLATRYEWYMTVSDGTYTLSSAIWSFTTAAPTAVTVSSFTGKSRPNAVQLQWETANELGLVGFNVYRSETVDGVKEKLNFNLLPAKNPGQMTGAEYQYADAVNPGKQYYYWLELIAPNGTELISPVAVTTDYWILLPIVKH